MGAAAGDNKIIRTLIRSMDDDGGAAADAVRQPPVKLVVSSDDISLRELHDAVPLSWRASRFSQSGFLRVDCSNKIDPDPC
jgi:hypothetical protein